MGNCNPWSFTPFKTVGHSRMDTPPLEEAPIRFGSLGLSDCGFEYRQVSPNLPDEDELPETRLFHKATGTMITPENRKIYIPDGSTFDKVIKCCQQVAQQRLQDDYGLNWIELFNFEGDPVYALASPNYANNDPPKPVLMVFTGKGKSRAGILSVRELLVSGLERGSAMYHIQQATQRGWKVIVLDPNARGKTEGLVLIRWSLDHLDWTGISPIYILSHSAAGGYLVHYLLEGDHRQELLARMHGLVFTDSTHTIQWAKNDVQVGDFLQSQKVLYVRNCSENPSDTFACHKHKKAGEHHEGNQWWLRRFGNIRTVWAGTVDHAAMCWVARQVIWDFFDERSKQTFQQSRSDINVNDGNSM